MLILAITLTILGIIVFRWITRGVSEPFYNRPLILHKTINVFLIQLLSIGLLGGGLYLFWRVNPKIVLFLVGLYTVLWIYGFVAGSEKNKAKKFFQIYKQLKLYRPTVEERELWKEATKLYFKKIGHDDTKAEETIEYIFNEIKEIEDIKALVVWIFVYENPDPNPMNIDIVASMKKSEKRHEAVSWAYEKVFSRESKVVERPVLSEDSLKKIRMAGLNPDEMTNEQLAALAEMENADKSSWIVTVFYFAGGVVFINAIFSLFKLNFGDLVFSLAIAFALMYVGSRIQTKRAMRKFQEASILKWSESQRDNQESVS